MLLKKAQAVSALAITLGIILLPIVISSPPTSQAVSSYPQIQNVTINVNESESKTISVLINNSGSSISWSGLRLSFLNPDEGIKISTNSLLFEEGFIQAYSDNYSLRIGISVNKNVSVGSYTLLFTLTATSSTGLPSVLTTAYFNVIIIVHKSQPMGFPIIYFYLGVIFIVALTMIGIVLIWSKNWNISEVKK
jgi:hypothetical protein